MPFPFFRRNANQVNQRSFMLVLCWDLLACSRPYYRLCILAFSWNSALGFSTRAVAFQFIKSQDINDMQINRFPLPSVQRWSLFGGLLLAVVRRERSLDSSELSLPPVIGTFRLFDDSNSVTFSKYQIAFTLTFEIV